MPSEPQKTAIEIGSGDVHPAKDMIGEVVDQLLTMLLASMIAGLIIAFNTFLLYQTFFGG